MKSQPSTKQKSRQSRMQEETYYRVMRLLQQHPDMSQRELADKVGISLGALNYCLRALIEKGFVKLGNFQNSKHKSRYAYILTPVGLAHKMAMTGRFLKRKIEEYEALKQEIDALREEAKSL